MEQATVPRPAAASLPRRPPGTRLPATLQVLAYARDPLGFLIGFQRRYGDVFRVSFPFFKDLVYVADPGLVKQLFTTPPEQAHAGEANATVLEPALGPHSVLTLDEAPHMRQRKLLLPPFHGERIERYGELMREVTLREMETWPVGEPFALRPHTQRIALAVIMRAVFGVHDERQIERFEGLVERFAGRLSMVTALPPLRRNYGRWSPWARFLRARRALDDFVYEQIALRRAEVGDADGDADDVLALLMSARHEDGSPMIAALHYREDLFPEPQEFRPERFLEGKADSYAWIPFGGGVRRCIGAAFAEYEMRVVLRAILERAELSAPDPKPEKVTVRNITLAPGKGTVVRLDRPLSY